jgi:hypothetical protein
MIPHAVAMNDISYEDLASYRRVCALFALLPDDARMTCHAFARLAAPLAPGFSVVDGRFGPYTHTHSWLQKDRVIIDAYPWASATPHIIAIGGLSPWRPLFIKEALPEAVETAHRLVSEIRTGITQE